MLDDVDGDVVDKVDGYDVDVGDGIFFDEFYCVVYGFV